MTLTLTLTPLPSGRRVRVILHSEEMDEYHNYHQDVRTDLMYEAITEITNNAIRRLVNKLEPRLREIRKTNEQLEGER